MVVTMNTLEKIKSQYPYYVYCENTNKYTLFDSYKYAKERVDMLYDSRSESKSWTSKKFRNWSTRDVIRKTWRHTLKENVYDKRQYLSKTTRYT